MSVVDEFEAMRNYTAKELGRFFCSMGKDKQDAFKALPVHEQMALLKVPVRAQTRYKKEGVWWYIRVKVMGGGEEDGRRRGKSTKAIIESELAKSYEKEVREKREKIEVKMSEMDE